MSVTHIKPLICCFSGSPFAWRALIVLEEKGIEYESKRLPRSTGEHRTPHMLAPNPRGRLPILRYGDWEPTSVGSSLGAYGAGLDLWA